MNQNVLGIDPGFASLGWAVVELCPDPSGYFVVDAGVFHTEKSSKRLNVRSSCDNWRRAVEMHRHLKTLLVPFNIVAVCAEAMSFPRNASAAGKMSMTWGVLAALLDDLSIPIAQATPQDIKLAVCGRKNADKAEVQAGVIQLVSLPLNGHPKADREHIADAIGAVIACEASEVMKMARNPRPGAPFS